MRMQTLCVLAMVAACGTGAARADIGLGGEFRKFMALGEDLVDGLPGGPGVSMFTITVPASDVGADTLTGFEDFFVQINHTWVGDLVITLSHVDAEGDTITLLDRPGVPPSGVGNSDNLLGTYYFVDSGGMTFPELSAGPGKSVPTGTYNVPGPGLFADFNNGSAIGTWLLQIEDFAQFDTGVLVSWGFGINTIPSAWTAGLFGVAGLAGLRRRR